MAGLHFRRWLQSLVRIAPAARGALQDRSKYTVNMNSYKSISALRRRREALGHQLPFEYPEALRTAAQSMPSAPGVYVFHGQDGDGGAAARRGLGGSAHVRGGLRHVCSDEEPRGLPAPPIANRL